jgi:hypothetical protein
MQDFLTFRRMMTPVIIQFLFWLGVIGCVSVGLGTVLIAGKSSVRLSGLAMLFFGPIAVRILCELSILYFRMNETLTDIRNSLIPITGPIEAGINEQEVCIRSSKPVSPEEASESKPSKLKFTTKEEYEKWKAEKMKLNKGEEDEK